MKTMKTISKFLLIPLVISMGVATVSVAEASQHPSYPFDEGNYWTDSAGSDARINFSMDSLSITTDKASQHPFYPSSDANQWTDATGSGSRVNFSVGSMSDYD